MTARLSLALPLLALIASGALLGPPLDGAPAPPKPSRELKNSIGMKLVRVPKGKFMMGSPAVEAGIGAAEGPQHEVEITRPFYLGAYEVTQEQYQKVTGSNPSYFSPTGGGAAQLKGLDTRAFPVETVSWTDAVAFCEKLSAVPAEKRAGRTYRLPTEAEWEYACRGGAKDYAPFGLGKELTSKDANIQPWLPGRALPYLGRPTTVGSYKKGNGWGLFDMHGNVWEWCHDWHDTNYYKVSPRADPKGPPAGTYRVLRGGAWASSPQTCRSAIRGINAPNERNQYLGFRVACVSGR
jgi:formylglycine-generating enzyme required for sulfatase activity